MNDTIYYTLQNIKKWALKYRRLLMILSVVLILLTTFYFVWGFIDRQGKFALEVDVFPRDATVTIDNQTRIKRGVNYLTPGTYTLSASKNGYRTFTQKITVSESNESNFYAVLKEVGYSDKKYDKSDLKAILEVEGKAGAASAKFTSDFEARYPIVKNLPIRDPYYKIGYLSDGKGGGLYLTVYTESPRYRSNALRRIQGLGEDISKYKIVFQDYENPLTGEKQ